MIEEDFENLDKILGSEYNDFTSLAREKLLGTKDKVLTILQDDGKQDGQTGTFNELSIGDMLASVMTPEQLTSLSANNDTVYSMLSKEQKHRLDDGEDLFSIIEELDPDKRQQIEQMSQGIYESLSDPQKKDLLFLGSVALGGESLATRQTILQWMKDNHEEIFADGKTITYEDLVKMGFYSPGEMEAAGRDWARQLDLEYRLINEYGSSIAMLDREQALQRWMERTMVGAMAAGPYIGYKVHGPALAPKDILNKNIRLEGIELEGWSIKGPQSFMPPPEAKGNPGGQPAGTANTPPNDVPQTRVAVQNSIRSIAFPCISTGRFRFPVEKAAKVAVQTAKDIIGRSNITEIYFVCFDEQNFNAYAKELSTE